MLTMIITLRRSPPAEHLASKTTYSVPRETGCSMELGVVALENSYVFLFRGGPDEEVVVLVVHPVYKEVLKGWDERNHSNSGREEEDGGYHSNYDELMLPGYDFGV